MMNVSQNAFTAGTDPQVANEDYSNGFVAIEPYEFNTICVDTEETAVHILMQSFIKRISMSVPLHRELWRRNTRLTWKPE